MYERPRLGNFKFIGIKKSDAEELQTKIGLAKQTIITENMRRNIVEVTTKFYADKGYQNVTGDRLKKNLIRTFANSNFVTIYVDRGEKVHINDIGFYGNESVEGMKLKKQMKGTKEQSRLTLYPTKEESPFGPKKKLSFSEYVKDWGFLSFSKTKALLDPYFRFKVFSSAKFDLKKYEEDKEKILNYYNSLGYRDAQIVDETRYPSKNGDLNVDIKMDEGRSYYFGNIVWKGNAKYPDSVLNTLLGHQ